MRNESMNPSAEWSPYKPNFFHHLTSYRNRTSNLIITLDSFFASIHIQIGPLIVVIFWMKANHKLRTSRNLTAQLKVQQEWALRCTCSSPPKPAHMDCSSVYLQTPQLAGKNLIFTPKKLAKLLFTRQQSQDWWLTSWKQFGNANLEKIAHPGKTPKKKKLKYPLIHCESLSGLQSTKDRIGWSDHTVSYEHGAADHTQPEYLKRMWYKTSWPPNLCNHIW